MNVVDLDAIRRELQGAMSEADWQHMVVRYLRLHGWTTFVWADSRRADASWPDVTAMRLRDGITRVMVIECKALRGKLTKTRIVRDGRTRRFYERQGQEETIAMLRKCPALEVYVLKPTDEDWNKLQEVTE